ncbi:substrate-binding domain-containing protein [Paenibacillus protaetiae]|nr:substrate-binding domain-containing protein [Paenibacillus protaetiae]
MRMQRLLIAAALLLVAVSIYAAFSFKLFQASERVRTITVILKSNDMNSSFWQTVRAGAEAAAKETGANVSIVGPLQEQNTGSQIQLLEEAVKQKPQAIVIAPSNDRKLLPALDKAHQAGIKLVAMDSPVELDHYQPVLVSNNHVEAGMKAGAEAANENGGRPVVSIISDTPASPVSAAREKGILSAIADYPDSYYDTYYAGGTEDGAYEAVKILMGKNTNVNTVITLNETTALGAAKALKELGKTESTRLIGFDSSIYQIQLMEEGTMDALIVEKPFNMGYLAVKTAVKMIDGERAGITLIDPQVVTRDNMYNPENQKLLFPLTGN